MDLQVEADEDKVTLHTISRTIHASGVYKQRGNRNMQWDKTFWYHPHR